MPDLTPGVTVTVVPPHPTPTVRPSSGRKQALHREKYWPQWATPAASRVCGSKPARVNRPACCTSARYRVLSSAVQVTVMPSCTSNAVSLIVDVRTMKDVVDRMKPMGAPS